MRAKRLPVEPVVLRQGPPPAPQPAGGFHREQRQKRSVYLFGKRDAVPRLALQHGMKKGHEPSPPDQAGEIVGEAAMVPGELLIRTLSIEHHLEACTPSGVEHAPLGKDARAAVGLVLMPGNPLGQRKGVLETRIAPMRVALRALDHRLHVWAFIDALYVVAGADAIYLGPVAPGLEFARHQAHDRGAVEPAREAAADRDVR